MENIGPGHWVFAGIFVLLFLGVIIFAYRKDRAMHQTYYKGSAIFVLTLVVLLFVVWLFRNAIIR